MPSCRLIFLFPLIEEKSRGLRLRRWLDFEEPKWGCWSYWWGWSYFQFFPNKHYQNYEAKSFNTFSWEKDPMSQRLVCEEMEQGGNTWIRVPLYRDIYSTYERLTEKSAVSLLILNIYSIGILWTPQLINYLTVNNVNSIVRQEGHYICMKFCIYLYSGWHGH